ncbi:UDP-glucuronosyl/UDP-glucosyltransferase [Cinara cedri]|uniref:UDP-glucuronosyl/UDP-glucosyltransferase n=1 Tax=Cinara cedri TaxID=506608 RepID=A0A5E4MM30_9HEMI|nr:UDP-glucuronosyl/UDP-glucosyltransferase [Cinara cedri]
MKYIAIFVILLYFYVRAIRSSNILVFIPSPWKSHIISFQPLFSELANRGHNVTVVSKFSIQNPPRNYTQLVPSYEFDIDGRSDFLMHERSKFYMFFEEPKLRNTILVESTRMYLADKVVQKFIKEDKSSFDLIIVEAFFQECTVALGHKYNAPVISIVPVTPWLSISRWSANPTDFSYIKDFTLDGGRSLNFWERFTNTFVGLYTLFLEPITYIPQLENMMDTYFQYPGYDKRPTMAEMLKNISLSLIDSDVMILSPRPYLPSYIEVPGIHLRPTKKINAKLQYFMDRANKGVIYFNFGTILNVTSIPKPSFQALVNVLGRLEQRIVFKWINNETRGFPNNFYVDSWLPQREILSHPNCKLFITHGGIHGLIETIDAGIPIIGLPVFGDQFQNVKTSQDNGIAIMSNIFSLTEETFEKDVSRILTDQKFAEKAKKMSAIFRDRPLSALDKAVYWVEYVIRHEGADHLRSAAVELTWYQYYLLDVFAFIISIILFLLFIFKVKPVKFINVIVTDTVYTTGLTLDNTTRYPLTYLYTFVLPINVFKYDNKIIIDIYFCLVRNYFFKENNKYLILFEDIYIRNIIGLNLTQQFISCTDVQKFIKEDQSTFDLVIVESFFQQCTVAMGHKYSAPVINIIPVSPCATHSISATNPFDFSYIKDYKTDSGKSLNFQNRLLNTFFGLYTLFVEPIIYNPKMENMMNTYFKYPGYETRPTMTEMLKNVSLSLIDSDIVILNSRPYVPSFFKVPASIGVVFLNFGTVLRMNDISKTTLDIFKKVLGRLKQNVIFKWIHNSTQGFQDNFYVDSWLPQVEILKHPNCKLFITHGGIHSLMETIDAGVP